MSKGIFIATLDADSGKSLISIGLMRALLGKKPKVAYFRPIISDDSKPDNHIDVINSYFDIDIPYEKTHTFTFSEVINALNNEKKDELIDRIIEHYKSLEDQFDFVLVEGTDYTKDRNLFELDINILIAKNLKLPSIIISSGFQKSKEAVFGSLQLAYNTFLENEINVYAVIANKIQENNLEVINNELRPLFPKNVTVAGIPIIENLAKLTVREILDALDGKILFGENYLDNLTDNYGVGAMQLPNYLDHIKKDSLVITPGDRADILLGALQANISTNYPRISGIVLTGGIIPSKSILKLIKGLSPSVPIISVGEGTYAVTNKIGSISPKIYANNQKIELSIANYEKYIDADLVERLIDHKTDKITPRMFQYNLVKKARSQKRHIVLPEGNDIRILKATAKLMSYDIVDITLLGNEEEILQIISKERISINPKKIQIINPPKSKLLKKYVETFYELRKHKNVNLDMARDAMVDCSYFGTMMVYMGDADAMVSGAVNTTQHTIRPALQFIKTKKDVSIVSSVFFMCLEDRVSVFGDCAINPNPTAIQLAEIAISSAESAIAFGLEPKIAMLSYSSGNSGKGEEVDKVRLATSIVKEMRPDLKIEGPIQYDAAVDSTVAKTKLPNSEVAGNANVLIFPDLNTGNNTYKAIQRETGALAIGPMLQGLNKPVNDLSRGCTVNDIFNTVIISAIQSQN